MQSGNREWTLMDANKEQLFVSIRGYFIFALVDKLWVQDED